MVLLDGTVTDQNDIAVAGALVYVYERPSGLASLVDVLNQPIDNPVTTDDLGYWSAYVTTDKYYTLHYRWGGRLRLIEGGILAGDPPLFGPSSDPNLRTDLADDDGAGLSGFMQSGTGATARTLLLKNRETLTVTDYGANNAGVRAAVAELNARGGFGTLRFASSALSLASADLASNGSITVSANDVTVECEGVDLSITGNTVAPPVFQFTNCSNSGLRNLNAIGNDQGIAGGLSGTLVRFLLDDSATGDMVHPFLDNIQINGHFKAERIISALNSNTAGKSIIGWRDKDIRCFSTSGQSISPALIGVSSAVVFLYGYTGDIYDIESTGLYGQLEFMKSLHVMFGSCFKASIKDASAFDTGVSGASDDCGAYSYMIYRLTGTGANVEYLRCTSNDPRSCGFYGQGIDNLKYRDCEVSGQTDVNDGTIPKGGIAVNSCTGVRIKGGKFADNYRDISIVAASGATNLDAEIEGAQASGSPISIVVNPGAGAAGAVDKFWMRDCDITADSVAVAIRNASTAGRRMDSVRIEGGRISGGAANVVDLSSEGAHAGTGYIIDSDIRTAGGTALYASNMTGRVTVEGILAGLSGTTLGIEADNSTALHIDAHLRNLTNGYKAEGTATPTFGKPRFTSVTNRNTATSYTLEATATWNPGSLADGAGETSADIPVSGADVGDTVHVFAPYDLQGITCTGYVRVAGQVRIRLQNESTAVVDLASGSWKVRAEKF